MATASQRLVTEAALAEVLGGASAGVATGTGRPDGTRTPSKAGELYLDTAKTDGAILWVATTATSTGWQVVIGDTGRITVTPINGWTGNLIFQRVGGTVHLSFDTVDGAAQTANAVLAAPPAGFTVTPGVIYKPLLNTGDPVARRAAVQSSGVYIYNNPSIGALSGQITYPTSSAWPSLG